MSVFSFCRAILIQQICPSVTLIQVSDENGLIYRHSFFTMRNHSSFTSIRHLHGISTESPPAGALNTGVV